MDLREYLNTIWKEDIDAFTAKGGFSKASLYSWMAGICKPNRRYAKKIEELTEGKVSFQEMRSIKNGK